MFSGVPKLVHAWQAIAVFAVIGPPIGLLALFYGGGAWPPLWIALNPLTLITAFFIGGPAALLSGVIFCGLSLAVVFSKAGNTVRAVRGALLGAVAGLIGSSLFYALSLYGTPNYPNNAYNLIWPGMVSGLLSGLLSGWLLPVGAYVARVDASH
jgi:hypothetical protein